MKMLERRVWPNLAYILLFFLVCITVWQIVTTPAPLPDVMQYTTMYTLYTYNASTYSHPMHSLPYSDYHHLIDLNFTFTILSLTCNDSSPFLLVLTHSSPENFAKRKTIRETWGHYSHKIRVVFMLGAVKNSTLQRMLEEENEVHGDFVQGDFLDTYRNITYKHVMALKYSIYHCPQAKYILKTDDDVFVNMPAMLHFLTADLSPYGAAKMLFCTPRRNSLVLRTYRSKWRVSFKEYAAKTYPTYCPGWTLLYSPDVVFDLYREAQEADYFWIDDVLITGILAERIRVSHTDIENLVLTNKNQNDIVKYSYNVTQPFLYGKPNLDERQIRALWEFVKSHHTPRSVLKEIE